MAEGLRGWCQRPPEEPAVSPGWQQTQTLVQGQLHSELLLCRALCCAEQVTDCPGKGGCPGVPAAGVAPCE